MSTVYCHTLNPCLILSFYSDLPVTKRCREAAEKEMRSFDIMAVLSTCRGRIFMFRGVISTLRIM